jgi:hypothetical protein
MAGGWNLKIYFSFCKENSWTLALNANLGRYNEVSWTNIQDLFESLYSLTQLLNIAMVEFSNFWDGCKNYTSQRGAMAFCMLTNPHRMANFY